MKTLLIQHTHKNKIKERSKMHKICFAVAVSLLTVKVRGYFW